VKKGGLKVGNEIGKSASEMQISLALLPLK